MSLFKDIYTTPRLYAGGIALASLFVLSYFFELFEILALLGAIVLPVIILLEVYYLFSEVDPIKGARIVPTKLSNGDPNKIYVNIKSNSTKKYAIQVLDEIPAELQIRDFSYTSTLAPKGSKEIEYEVVPKRRGIYKWGQAIVLLQTPCVGLMKRRIRLGEEVQSICYPSFQHLRDYELMAINPHSRTYGQRRVRRLGQTMEFEQIRNYVQGDDFRNLNWKATASQGQLMVNQFQDERAQQVYCIVDKGRGMRNPFDGMTLLDYAINASLGLSRVILAKHDKVGLITFSKRIDTFLPPDGRITQFSQISNSLYAQSTDYSEPNHELLAATLQKRAGTRSLIILFTNFDTLATLNRSMPYFRSLAKSHHLLVVFFANTELYNVIYQPATDLEDIYTKSVAERFAYEKRLMAKELSKYGITGLLTPPKGLTLNVINKYLEIKSRYAM